MSASTGDKITDVRNSARPNTARVTTVRVASASSLACDSLTGWPTASKVHFVTYQVDTNGDVVAGTQLDCSGIVSANTLTNVVVIDGTDGGNAVGDYVEMLPTAAWGQDLADGLTQTLNRDGTLKDDIVENANIGALAVGTTEIAANAVTTAKLDSAITTRFSNLETPSYAYGYISAGGIGNAEGVKTLVETASSGITFNGTTRYTATIKGIYIIHAQQLINSTGAVYWGIRKNGSWYRYAWQNSIMQDMIITAMVELSIGDYIEIYQTAIAGAWQDPHSAYHLHLIKRT